MSDKKAILVIGAGDATGGAIARRFAREGYVACVMRRSADKLAPLVDADQGRGRPGARLRPRRAQGGGGGRAGRADRARDRADRGGGVQHRRQRALRHPETTARVYHKVWEMACFGGFLMGREVGQGDGAARPRHDHLHRRDAPACAAATASPPSPAPSMRCARWRRAWRASCGPQGIHVAHLVIDGAIDTEFIRTTFPERYALKDQDGILDPEHIADAYWQLHMQPRDAWTHELDLRPWLESW